MLGLRPRLKSRLSLLDLIQKKNIDQISASVERAVPTDVEPQHVPLPASPLISPQEVASRPQLPPPRITLHRGSDTEEETAKMPPVSFDW
jgi:V-type H+-transporting ATPase subunit A